MQEVLANRPLASKLVEKREEGANNEQMQVARHSSIPKEVQDIEKVG